MKRALLLISTEGGTVIDDTTKAMALAAKMEACLPIPVRPTSAFVRLMRQYGIKIGRDRELSVRRVFYMGDEAGISCDVTPPEIEKTPVICSLTQLRVMSSHPLAKEVRAYQRERASKLARAGREPTSFSVEPRKQHRH
jgi:hypothetical protein